MPKIDPITGCSVMTMTEFWAAEAQKEGIDVAEVMEDFHNDMAADEEKTRQGMLKDFSGALEKLKEYYNPEYDDSGLVPVEVLEITDADCSYGYSKSKSSFVAKVQFQDQVRNVQYSEVSYNGSFYEPPDFEANCVIL